MNAALEAVDRELQGHAQLSWRDKIAVLVRGMGHMPQVECPLKHYFAPGVYLREIFMPAGSVVIGKIHKTEHFNIIQKGCSRWTPQHHHRRAAV